MPSVLKNYSGIFDARGNSYDAAMRAVPHARRQEFGTAIALAGIQSGDRVLDFPSGGGYIEPYMPKGVALALAEKSEVFFGLAQGEKIFAQGNSLPVPDGSFDKIVSVAGIHHDEDQPGFFRECARVLKTDGILCVGDVLEGSAQAKFLDVFVDRYAPEGHRGIFLSTRTTRVVEAAGLKVHHAKSISYPWVFASEEQMASFCRDLFGLENITLPEVSAGLREYLNVREERGQVLLDWSLYFIKARKWR